MVVLADLADLSDSADTNCTLSAVANVVFPYVSSPCDGCKTIVFNYAEMGIPLTNRYFNAGVMVINSQALAGAAGRRAGARLFAAVPGRGPAP